MKQTFLSLIFLPPLSLSTVVFLRVILRVIREWWLAPGVEEDGEEADPDGSEWQMSVEKEIWIEMTDGTEWQGGCWGRSEYNPPDSV